MFVFVIIYVCINLDAFESENPGDFIPCSFLGKRKCSTEWENVENFTLRFPARIRLIQNYAGIVKGVSCNLVTSKLLLICNI